MVGASTALNSALALVLMAARSEASILLCGDRSPVSAERYSDSIATIA